ncbi:signal peptide peptidase SppA [Candidatus Blochmanniella vafra str. BVAF]|uniref:Signal peptide peptidase SppA n=1 Tax=Blochmanniella vafra (strain BVAF) TaxID=859654 RepID=E8Q6D2_BLOVB|nr:signal peptide peptidase SppA [Candidatus Blochmannia vafer]ADV33826.1 signal peptide peptidase SppA [Candidatus Blochmannia vafer str. BVAF]
MKIAWNLICKIFKSGINVLNIIRITILNILLLIFIIIGISIYFHIKNTKNTTSPSALILNLTGIIVDKPTTYTKFQKFSKQLFNINQSHIQENSLFEIIHILRQAKNDTNITGLILLLKNFSGGSQSSLEYIGKALYEFKNTGKPIYAISDHYDQIQYLLASYANKIYITPQGEVNLRGISTHKLYYQSLLKNLKINTHVFRVGSYKSAIEPFTRDNMSPQVRDEENIWIHQLWDQYLKIISLNRNITTQQIFPGINKIIDELYEMQGDTAYYALQKKWVDEISSYSDIENTMKKTFGTNKNNTSFNSISIYDYNLKPPITKNNNNQIAIICIQGTIIHGNNDIAGSTGGDTIVRKIRNARFNPKIKAIILRVNSPGGSVHASELIRQEIIATRNSGKPIIVSMGNIAASGGYWISTPANFIIASNSTLTGSIGVFGIINTFEDSLDTIGVHSDEVNTSPVANLSIAKALPNEFKNMMQLYVNTSYQYFIKTVAKFRCKTITDIDRVAQGHIWLGYDAIKNGLIDKIGDFDDAINKAAELAHLTEYQLNWHEDKINWINIIIQQTNKIVFYAITNLLNHYIVLNNLEKFIKIHYTADNHFTWNDPKNCYAICCNYVSYH